MSPKQKIAIVTGGASGLGFGIAKKFSSENIITYVIGRDEQKLQKAASELGSNIRTIAFDLTKLDEIPSLVKRIADENNQQIDILVNNAGINQKKELLEVTNEDFQRIILTNLTSVFAMTREVSRYMLEKNSGSIINISSMAAQYGLPKVVSYSAAKTGIEGMTRALASELSVKGVRVNCIAPGFIYTDMTDKAFASDPERRQRAINRTPMGKMGLPQDVANAAYFFASDDSTFVTGTVLPVDGGNAIGF
jgi:NAD(P)-dependent dehydrogenase (short-subunit alcohol dehydrogenase family)